MLEVFAFALTKFARSHSSPEEKIDEATAEAID